jgi:hypothetical protein
MIAAHPSRVKDRPLPISLPFPGHRRATPTPFKGYRSTPPLRPGEGEPGRLIDQLHLIAGPRLPVLRDLLSRFTRKGVRHG